MSNVTQKIEELEASAVSAKEVVAQRDALVKLASTPEFRKLIVEGYLRDETARLTHISSEPGMTPQDRADAMAMAQATGHFKRWMNALIQMGNHAEKGIKDIDEMISEMRENPNDFNDDEGEGA